MEIGIDLGTANVLVYQKGKGIVLQEPSVVATDKETGKILAIGEEARRMLGRTPGSIVASRPMRDGVIADYEVTLAMLQHFIGHAVGKRLLLRPRVMVCIPAGATTVERRAVRDAGLQAGAGQLQLIEEPLAAALGAGIDVSKPAGCMVVDIGGGTTDVAVLSLGGIVVSQSVRVAGDEMDEAIVRQMKRSHNLMIGERSAEELKIRVGTAWPGHRREILDVRGRDLVTGMPRTLEITSDEVCEALREALAAIVEAVKQVLERTPPELAGDVMDQGIVLTGGGCLLDGLDTLLARETGIPTFRADDPITCVVRGTGKALDHVVEDNHLVVLCKVMG